eukprot:COSAG02_NODE_7969_length_2766_cov_2.214098_5_plen_32_part_00
MKLLSMDPFCTLESTKLLVGSYYVLKYGTIG